MGLSGDPPLSPTPMFSPPPTQQNITLNTANSPNNPTPQQIAAWDDTDTPATPPTHHRACHDRDPQATATQQGPNHPEAIPDYLPSSAPTGDIYTDKVHMTESKAEEPEPQQFSIKVQYTSGNSISFTKMNIYLTADLTEQSDHIRTLTRTLACRERRTKRPPPPPAMIQL